MVHFQVTWKLARPIYVLSLCIVACIKKRNLLLAGKSKDEAMNDYITKVKQLLEEAGMPAW